MAEFCKDCWNKMFNTKGGRIKYIMSKDLELCEGCARYKRVVLIERAYYYRCKFLKYVLPVLGVLVLIALIVALAFLII